MDVLLFIFLSGFLGLIRVFENKLLIILDNLINHLWIILLLKLVIMVNSWKFWLNLTFTHVLTVLRLFL